MKREHVYNHLTSLIREDNENAFNELYNLFFSPLCVFAQRYLSNRNEIEDCVQEIFLKIWKDRKKLNVTTSIRSYLLTSTKNSCLNLIEKNKSKQSYEQYILNTYDAYTPEDLYSTEEIEELIKKAIANLPEKYREVFIMNRFENLTYREIAEIKKISIKTVEAYISKSLSILSISLKDYFPLIAIFLFGKN